jgi:hypothetical protein
MQSCRSSLEKRGLFRFSPDSTASNTAIQQHKTLYADNSLYRIHHTSTNDERSDRTRSKRMDAWSESRMNDEPTSNDWTQADQPATATQRINVTANSRDENKSTSNENIWKSKSRSIKTLSSSPSMGPASSAASASSSSGSASTISSLSMSSSSSTTSSSTSSSSVSSIPTVSTPFQPRGPPLKQMNQWSALDDEDEDIEQMRPAVPNKSKTIIATADAKSSKKGKSNSSNVDSWDQRDGVLVQENVVNEDW